MSDAKLTVFIVDDDVSVRESLKLLIESAAWQPETFGSGQQFLAHPRVLAASCLVLDVLLPDPTIPAKRAATVEEIAQTILFVASDKAKYLTGQIISVDGGFSAQ